MLKNLFAKVLRTPLEDRFAEEIRLSLSISAIFGEAIPLRVDLILLFQKGPKDL